MAVVEQALLGSRTDLLRHHLLKPNSKLTGHATTEKLTETGCLKSHVPVVGCRWKKCHREAVVGASTIGWEDAEHCRRTDLVKLWEDTSPPAHQKIRHQQLARSSCCAPTCSELQQESEADVQRRSYFVQHTFRVKRSVARRGLRGARLSW